MKSKKNMDCLLYTGLFLTGWSLVLAVLLIWNYKYSYDTMQDIALYKLRSYFSEVMEARQWSLEHGGVFLSTAHSQAMNGDSFRGDAQPSIREYDAPAIGESSLSTGDKRNRGLQEGLHVRTISLHSKKPSSKPDGWELQALKDFDNGATEAFALTRDDAGNPIFRYSAPLKVDYTCISCHQDETYLLDKVKGGISITTRAKPLMTLRAAESRLHLIGYGFIWLLGCCGIVVAMNKLRKSNEHRIMQEKFVGVMEMAGAAAHELNQPLQVISGCMELILTARSNRGKSFIQHSRQIMDSVDRLAVITRKINMITHYVTTDYVGDTKIIDLEKAASVLDESHQGPETGAVNIPGQPPVTSRIAV